MELHSRHSYRTLDRIENLKIRIKFYRKSDQMILVDELDVKWQESITLPEAAPFSEDAQASSYLKQSPKKSKSKSSRKRRLFTIVNDNNLENAVEDMNISSSCTENLKSSRGLERALEPIVANQNYFGKVEESLFVADDKDILGIPSSKSDRWSQIHKTSVYCEMMFGVSLPVKTQNQTDDSAVDKVDSSRDIEKIICKIQYSGNGNFSISPKFTNQETKEMHEIHIGDDTYLYTIENSSNSLSDENEEKEKLIFEEFFKRQHSLRMGKLGGQIFDGLPESYHQRCCFNGEIISCKGFHSDVLYCQYLIHVPSEWKTDENQLNLLSAHTQVSYCTILEGELDRIAFFGFPIEINLITTEKTPRPLKIFIKVYSVDSSDRHCIEGYGYTTLPLDFGSEEFILPTWRPLFQFQEQLKSFFLGGSPDLIDFKFDNIEDIQKPFNRYGFQTEASGKVKLKFNMLKQIHNPDLQRLSSPGSSSVPAKLLVETNYALERAKLRLQTLKSMEAASSAEAN